MDITLIISESLLTEIEHILKSNQSTLVPVYSAIGGAIVGGIISYFPQAWLRTSERKERARTLKSALIAEMDSVTETILKRGYLSEIERIINELQQEQNPYSKRKFSLRISNDYNRIFKNTAADIGILSPSFANNVVRFYSTINSIALDTTNGGFFFEEGGIKQDFVNLRTLISEAISISNANKKG